MPKDSVMFVRRPVQRPLWLLSIAGGVLLGVASVGADCGAASSNLPSSVGGAGPDAAEADDGDTMAEVDAGAEDTTSESGGALTAPTATGSGAGGSNSTGGKAARDAGAAAPSSASTSA